MNKNLFSWVIYDAANSFLTVSLGGFFLAQWVVLDNKFDDIWYGGTFTLATIFVLLTSPFWGAWSDKVGKRLPFIKWVTVLLILFGAFIVLVVLSNFPLRSRVLTVLALTVIIQYLYQVSLIFYNSLLEKISTDKNRGEISGLGDFFNNFAWIFATSIFLLFTTGKITLIGESGRSQVFLPALIFFSLLSLPMLFLFKEEKRNIVVNKVQDNIKDIYKKTIKGFRELFKENKNVGIFLIAFSLSSDAILTVGLYFAIVMDRLYKIPDTQKFVVLLIMNLSMAFANYFLGKACDWLGSKRILLISCLDLIASFTIASLFSEIWILYIIALCAGIGWGGFYSAARALMVRISPSSKLGEYFGFYSTFQRLSSVTGPLIWGAMTLWFKNIGDSKYRIAMMSLVFLMVIGTFLMKYVKEEKAPA